jgi:hypothetical protein
MKLTSAAKKNLLFISPPYRASELRVFAFLIFITGIATLFSGKWIGIFVTLFGLFFTLYKEGIVFNLKNHTVSRYITIGHYHHFYKTRSFKHFKYLSIVRVGVISKTILTSSENYSVNLKYRLTLIKDNQRYYKVTTDEYFKVFSLGKKIATHYNLGLVDYSKRYANWVIQPPTS